jgi:hypothetical protein
MKNLQPFKVGDKVICVNSTTLINGKTYIVKSVKIDKIEVTTRPQNFFYSWRFKSAEKKNHLLTNIFK